VLDPCAIGVFIEIVAGLNGCIHIGDLHAMGNRGGSLLGAADG
jgi:hypothetical protein